MTKVGTIRLSLTIGKPRFFEIETKREGFAFWYRNPQYTGQSSLGIAYVEAEQYKIVRPDFLFFAEQDGKMVVDLVDPHGLHLADALPKLKGIALYAEQHSDAYRRIESVAEVKGEITSVRFETAGCTGCCC
ncbi:hypothetical protein OHD52_07030 [Escherichia coli]|nr:hypothetical protein [Escherichia coli]